MARNLPSSFIQTLIGLGVTAILASCGSISGNRETPSSLSSDSILGLPGIARTIEVIGGTAEIPSARARSSWNQAAGRADHVSGHARFADLPSPAWTFAAGNAMSRGRWTSMEPLISNGTVYTLSWDQILSAVDLTTGQAKWQQQLKSKTEEDGVFGGGIALMGQTLYVATGAGMLHAVNLKTGAINWTVPLSAPSRSGPLIYEGRIYVTDILGAIMAFDQTGKQLWQQPAPGFSVSVLTSNTPVGADKGIYQVLPNGILRALLPSSQEAWQSYVGLQGTTGQAVDIVSGAAALPVIDNNFLLISSWANRTVAMTASTGEVIWDLPIGSASTPLLTDSYIFLVTKDGYLRALQRATGYQVWSINLGPETTNGLIPVLGWYGPLLAGGNLIVGSSEGTLQFVNPQTGELRFELQVGSPIVAPLSLADETLLVTTRDGLIHAYR